MRSTSNPRLAAELCLISLCDSTLGESVKELRARISRVEELLKNGIGAVQAAAMPAPADDDDDLPDLQPDTACDEFESDTGCESDDERESTALDNTIEDDNSYDDERGPWAMDDEPSAPAPMTVNTAPPPPPAADSPAPSGAAALSGARWKQLCELVAPRLSGDLRSTLDRNDVIRAVQDGGTLRIEVVPGFIYSRFSRREVLDRFAEAASALFGREMRAVIGEYRSVQQATRSLDELRAFPEVKFTNE
jgi:hypothetical protein